MRPVLKRIGNFQELGYDDDPAAPKLVEARGKRAPVNKREVVRYLNAARVFVFSPGYDQDVFDDRRRAGNCSIVTDGTFMWPKQLAYYLEHYDIELPAEFEAHMRANGWRVPEDIDISALKEPRVAKG